MNHPPQQRPVLDRIPPPGDLLLVSSWVFIAVIIAATTYALIFG